MIKCTQLSSFLTYLLDDEKMVQKAGEIIPAIWKARSARMSDIARAMLGNEARNYKCLQRFLEKFQPEDSLLRLYREEAPFVIGDPTEMLRPQAKQTGYVGKVAEGERRGYWLLFLATPYRGRALPFHCVSYSSKTINNEATSRNRYHFQAFARLKQLLGEKPLVLDREFSYLELMLALVVEHLHFVIRLKVGAQLFDAEGKLIKLALEKGKTRVIPKVFYMGKVLVNLVGFWQEGFNEPMWVITDLSGEEALDIYRQRMKIEEAFRDLKNLLGLGKMMCQKRTWMEKMVALMMIAYTLCVILGETLRDQLFPESHPKRKSFSGPFLWLKAKLSLSDRDLLSVRQKSLMTFSSLILPVRTHV